MPSIIHSTNLYIFNTNLCKLHKAKSGKKIELCFKLQRNMKNEYACSVLEITSYIYSQ